MNRGVLTLKTPGEQYMYLMGINRMAGEIWIGSYGEFAGECRDLEMGMIGT